MNQYATDDLRIASIKAVATPSVVCEEFPLSARAAEVIRTARSTIHNILNGVDKRLLVIAGPCSIHNPDAAIEYAQRLLILREKYRDTLFILMRVYFEKPRTTVGWKGLINDPMLDNSFEINKGLHIARKLLLDINEMGMPAGTEYLDLIIPQYFTDLIGWGTIGARTTESQVHREMASGLSCPVGFKNGTDGSISIAVAAIHAASQPHHFISLRKEGTSAIFSTTGNQDCHIILRGGKEPNYDRQSIAQVARTLKEAGLPTRIVVDFSHANSKKQYELQMKVGESVAEQLRAGDQHIFGVMVESNLVAGRQDTGGGKELVYGQSITDACLGWEDTETLIDLLSNAVNDRSPTG